MNSWPLPNKKYANYCLKTILRKETTKSSVFMSIYEQAAHSGDKLTMLNSLVLSNCPIFQQICTRSIRAAFYLKMKIKENPVKSQTNIGKSSQTAYQSTK